MCLDGKCFSFEDYQNKSICVFITGPGHLEFPWALETALFLKESGARVTIYDFSDFALTYSARISKFGITFPFFSRKIFRKVFLKPDLRIENVVRDKCTVYGIGYHRIRGKNQVNLTNFGKKIPISKLNNEKWGNLDAASLVQSHFSSKYKFKYELNDYVSLNFVKGIKNAIGGTLESLKILDLNFFDGYFLLNGRQPIQATLVDYFRKQSRPVILYESGGGRIFQDSLKPCIDYYFTNPANPTELQSKVSCDSNRQKTDQILSDLVLRTLQSRSKIPYIIDFIGKNSPVLQIPKNHGGRNFAFFATSDYEISILHERRYSTKFLDSQYDAVIEILKQMEKNDKLFIRLHPRDPAMPENKYVDNPWLKFKEDNRVNIISSTSRIDSYHLAENMHANFVWVSLLGYELSLRKIPVAILGNASYAKCVRDISIENSSQLQEFMNNPMTTCSDKLLDYTNYLTNGGVQLKISYTDKDHRIFLFDEQVDIYKKQFSFMPEKFRLLFS